MDCKNGLTTGCRALRPRQAQALLPQALALLAFSSVCGAQMSKNNALDNTSQRSPTEELNHVLHWVAYLLMACSAALLLTSAVALFRWPYPSCLCYSVAYSDAAVCLGSPCCACANIRQANVTMIFCWTMLLLCRMAIGFDLAYLYPYLGFCVLHAVTAALVHVLVRGVQRQQAEEAAATAAARGRMLLLHELGVPGALGRAGRPPAPLPPIRTMSAELVLVLQPDYCSACKGGAGGAAAGFGAAGAAGGGGGGGPDSGGAEGCEPRGAGDCMAGTGSGSNSRHAGCCEAWGAERWAAGADPGASAEAAAHAAALGKMTGALPPGVAWALRYTRVDPPHGAAPGEEDQTSPKAAGRLARGGSGPSLQLAVPTAAGVAAGAAAGGAESVGVAGALGVGAPAVSAAGLPELESAAFEQGLPVPGVEPASGCSAVGNAASGCFGRLGCEAATSNGVSSACGEGGTPQQPTLWRSMSGAVLSLQAQQQQQQQQQQQLQLQRQQQQLLQQHQRLQAQRSPGLADRSPVRVYPHGGASLATARPDAFLVAPVATRHPRAPLSTTSLPVMASLHRGGSPPPLPLRGASPPPILQLSPRALDGVRGSAVGGPATAGEGDCPLPLVRSAGDAATAAAGAAAVAVPPSAAAADFTEGP